MSNLGQETAAELEKFFNENINRLFFNEHIEEVPDEIYELDLGSDFTMQLESDSFDVDWLRTYAPWNRYETETKQQYELFKNYCDSPASKWNPESTYLQYIKRFDLIDDDNNRTLWMALFEQFDWLKRRAAFFRYMSWVEDKKLEIEHLRKIANMRNNQATILHDAGLATIKLLEKLTLRIDTLDEQDIKVSDIPKFITALNSFLGIAADAEARVLSISGLLEVLGEQIDRKMFQDNLFYIGKVQHKSQESINAEK